LEKDGDVLKRHRLEASPAGAEIRRREPMFKTSRRERTKAA
jgi:hypothetical protein